MTTKAKQAHQTPKEGAPPIKADRFDEMMRKALQVPPPSQELPGQQRSAGGAGKGRR
jgi:hypothetical protein